jgi:acyl transferase domain-containing protein
VIIESTASYLPTYIQDRRLDVNPLSNNVSASGINGANGTYVTSGHDDPSLSLLVFSASREESMKSSINNIEQLFSSLERPSLNDLAYTLGARRQHLSHRAFTVTDGSSAFEIGTKSSKISEGGGAPVFVFTGQGAQWPRMGSHLLLRYPSVGQDIRTMDRALSLLDLPPPWTIEGVPFL